MMDQAGLDPGEHARALAGLQRINRWSGSARTLWKPIHRLLRDATSSPLRILDVASGAGDVATSLWQKAKLAGREVEVHGWDISPVAVAYAQARADRIGANARFLQKDVLRSDWHDEYDVVVSSLFLHHLDDQEAIALLRRMRQCARRLLLINDLLRSRAGLMMAWLGTRILSRSPVVRVDGPISVGRAYTRREVRQLARHANLDGATVSWHWPYRFLLTWRPTYPKAS